MKPAPTRLQRTVGCLLACAVLVSMVAGPAWAQIYKLPHPDTTRGNFFGAAVAIDGDRAVVGASAEDACGPNAGAVYVYERDPESDTWHEATRLTASDCAAGDHFGRNLALSGDRMLVAAARDIFNLRTTNAAYVFERDTSGTWRQTAKLESDPDRREGAFATSVSLDGDRALITTSGDASEGEYGGAAYIYERDAEAGTWEQTARLTGSGGVRRGIFGGNGRIRGDVAVVAASTYFDEKPGSIYVFERDPERGAWREVERFGGIDDFFISLDLDGERILAGSGKAGRKKSGEAVLFERTAPGAWKRAAEIEPQTPYEFGAFGSLVALHGDRLLAAGYSEQLQFDFNIDRVVYIFARDPETSAWRQHRIADIGQVGFGAALDLGETHAIIGQAGEREPGAAYIVRVR